VKDILYHQEEQAMKKLWIILLLGILVTGCGTENRVSKDEPVNGNEGGQGIVAGEMAASMAEISPLVFRYEVKNQTEQEVNLKFTSSQRFDYSVKTKEGHEVFLFSSVASFLQALGEETLKQGEALTYKIDLKELALEKGEYTLTVWMVPQGGEKYTVTKEFTVE
jgi:ABC-type molybdate transport system substrate-binding protein